MFVFFLLIRSGTGEDGIAIEGDAHHPEHVVPRISSNSSTPSLAFHLFSPHHSKDINMSDPSADAAAAAAAAGAAAFRAATIEGWTLYAIGTSVSFLRMYARVKAVGFKGLQGDDYLACVAVVSEHNSHRESNLLF
jgi:hypothetical protein